MKKHISVLYFGHLFLGDMIHTRHDSPATEDGSKRYGPDNTVYQGIHHARHNVPRRRWGLQVYSRDGSSGWNKLEPELDPSYTSGAYRAEEVMQRISLDLNCTCLDARHIHLSSAFEVPDQPASNALVESSPCRRRFCNRASSPSPVVPLDFFPILFSPLRASGLNLALHGEQRKQETHAWANEVAMVAFYGMDRPTGFLAPPRCCRRRDTPLEP